MQKVKNFTSRCLVLVIFLVVPNISLAKEEPYKEEIYRIMKTQGLEAIKQRKQFTLTFLDYNKTHYEIMKIRFKGNQSALWIYTYNPKAELKDQKGFKVEAFEQLLKSFQDTQFFVMRIR